MYIFVSDKQQEVDINNLRLAEEENVLSGRSKPVGGRGKVAPPLSQATKPRKIDRAILVIAASDFSEN